jgi:antitoxin (DNA-binding transcriptional repressor) of toxin-antitoxin stability system
VLAAAGEEIIIARGSKPVAKLVALGEIKGKRQPGSMKGKLQALLDTHALLWWLSDHPALTSAHAKSLEKQKIRFS